MVHSKVLQKNHQVNIESNIHQSAQTMKWTVCQKDFNTTILQDILAGKKIIN